MLRQLVDAEEYSHSLEVSVENDSKQVRAHMLMLRLNDEELRRVKRLAEHFGLGKQDALRMLAKIEVDTLEANRQGSR